MGSPTGWRVGVPVESLRNAAAIQLSLRLRRQDWPLRPDRPKSRYVLRLETQARLFVHSHIAWPGPEYRALALDYREQDDATPYRFTSQRGGPVTQRTVHHVVTEAGEVG